MADEPGDSQGIAGATGPVRNLAFLSLLGVGVALGAIVLGNYLEGGQVSALLQLTSLVIVVGGTLGAVMIQTPMPDLRLAVSRLAWVFRPPRYERRAFVDRALNFSRLARRDGLLGLEKRLEQESDPFVRKCMRLLVDGLNPEDIRAVMEVEIDSALSQMARAARLYEAMAGYSPTIGILGAVLGLIHVMNNLTDPAELGEGIAVAFVATIYGVGFANLLLLPISNRLKTLAREQMEFHEMVVDGLTMIAAGDNPSTIQSKLEGYVD
ncbi:MAG: flagellar motor protein [Halieaceae bacterium]|jgi:chemotaxis protein MotA|nr:flagellar motor protein [Halieaceae bacterium]